VVLRRTADDVPMLPGRDFSWDEFLKRGEGEDGRHEVMEANEPAYILATSGTTARPKLAVHVHGGYQVGIYSLGRWCFGMKPTDVWWATSDIGWVVGHSYMVYAPLLLGCTTIAYEGALDYPGPETVWRVVEEFGVTGIFTSPTGVRLLMRYGEEAAKGYDLSSLERVVCAGEVLNAPAWEWLQKVVLKDRVPVIDHWWQTETGGPVIGNPYGVGMLPIKPGSAGVPLPGMEVAVMSPEGQELGPGEKGILVIKRPFPSLTPTLWGEPERYGRDYWQRIPGVYFTGDSAHIDEDGYVWFAGRADEVIKIAAHRIGAIEVESAFLKHPAVAEAGVTGRPDPVRGEVISAFVALKQGHRPSEELRRELLETVRRELGPVAVVGDINFVAMLPKTRSGKIMRRVLKAVVLDRDPGDISTIEDEGSVEEARQAWLQMRQEMAQGSS
jgi:acetyl-CoA synthetase